MELENQNIPAAVTDLKGDVSSSSKPRFTLVRDPRKAIELFDKLDDEAVASFIVPDTPIPPVPSEREVYDYLIQNALILIDGGELELARTILDDVVKYEPKGAVGLRWMAWCFWKEGKFADAEAWYLRLLEVRQSEEDFFELGEVYYQSQQYEKAQKIWLEAMKHCGVENPLLFDIYKNLGNVATILSDFDDALEQYHKALTLRPQSDVLQVNLGTLMLQQQDAMAGLRHFKAAVEINPHNDRAWCGVAMCAHALNDFSFASDAIKTALNINPQNQVALQLKSEEAQWTSK